MFACAFLRVWDGAVGILWFGVGGAMITVFPGGITAVCWSLSAWCLRNEGVSSVLLGASNTDQLMENIGAIQVRLQRVRFH